MIVIVCQMITAHCHSTGVVSVSSLSQPIKSMLAVPFALDKHSRTTSGEHDLAPPFIRCGNHANTGVPCAELESVHNQHFIWIRMTSSLVQ